ncbi:ATP-binding protein [Paucibacter soli]|uniref:ATP-binding protein n=1 Tax=Paucibacter soli TaxID=3133433 RepID=UPI0030A919AA
MTALQTPSTDVLPLGEEFMAALEAVSAPCFVHAGKRVLFANAAMRRLLGFTQTALQEMEFYAWATPAGQAALRYYGERCLSEAGELPVFEVEALTASCALRYLELSARRVQMGEQVFAVVTCQDLSDIRHVQGSLLDVGRVLHQIIENNPVATFVIDAGHRVTQWNAACATLTGIEASQLLGTNKAWQAFYAEQRPVLADLIVDASVDGLREQYYGNKCWPSALIAGAFEAEMFFPNFGENGRWLYFTAAPLTDAHGKLAGAIETLQDVTPRHLADEAMRKHRDELETMVADRTAEVIGMHQELEAFLENASVGIIATSRQRITRANKKFSDIFELEETSPVGMSSRSFFDSDAAYEELGRVAGPVLSRGESLLHEMEMCTAKGNKIWVQLIAYVADPNAPTAGTWWLMQDRTDVKRVQGELQRNFERIKETNARLEEAQNQLLQSEKMASIGQLAAGVAHEINNPIGFVSSNLSTLRRYVESMFSLLDYYAKLDLSQQPPTVSKELAALRQQVDMDFIAEDLPQLLSESDDGLVRVKKIVQDLKDFSRVDQSDWQEADINAGLESTLNVVMNEVKYKAEVRKHYGELPAVRCLAAQLNQVFMNLIVNAAHAIAERGVITLTTRVDGESVCISVCDTGCGMSEETRRRIFEPFYTTKPVGQGTGLGLSLSFSIVQKHGGRIEVESTQGQGSCFHVWIPIQGPTTA